jgi:hypothetical protein
MKSKNEARPPTKLWAKPLGDLLLRSHRCTRNRLWPLIDRKTLRSSSRFSELSVKRLIVEPAVNLDGI